jgi:hypothetical protein
MTPEDEDRDEEQRRPVSPPPVPSDKGDTIPLTEVPDPEKTIDLSS